MGQEEAVRKVLASALLLVSCQGIQDWSAWEKRAQENPGTDLLQDLDRALSADPGSFPGLHFLKGQVYYALSRKDHEHSQENLKKAEASLTRALDAPSPWTQDIRADLEIVRKDLSADQRSPQDQKNDQKNDQKQDQDQKNQNQQSKGDQGPQNQDSQKSPQDQKQDQGAKQEPGKREPGKQGGENDPSNRGAKGQDQGTAPSPMEPRDLSGRIQEKDPKAQDALTEALKQEDQRRQKQALELSGKLIPVDKDW